MTVGLHSSHSGEFLLLPFNDSAGAQLKTQRRAAVVAGVELGAVAGECTAVVHVDVVAALGLARAVDGVSDVDLEAGGGGDEGGEGSEEEDGGEGESEVE